MYYSNDSQNLSFKEALLDLRIKYQDIQAKYQDIKVENKDIQAKYQDIEAENKDIKAENKLLQQKNSKLSEQNKILTNELNNLKDKLNINSSNSGLPTSKEIYRIERKSKPKSQRNVGGQVGHSPNFYKFKTPDEIVDILPKEEKCTCGGALEVLSEVKSYQKIEIPPIKPVVTEYRLHSRQCMICAKKYKAGSNQQKLLGKNAESILASLGGFFNNSKREIKDILSQVFNLDISLGLVSKSEGRASVKLQDKYEELVLEARESQYLHLDETGAKNQDKRYWCWVAANKLLCVFSIMYSRSKKSLTTFLSGYKGKSITDRYGVYNLFDEAKRQICLAHLRRDFKRFMHSKNSSLSMVGKSLLDTIDLVFGAYNDFKGSKIDRVDYLRQMGALQKKMLYYLQNVSELDECKQAKRVSGNILKSFDMMWRFVEDEDIEPTNNFAERQIKHYVKYRKNSFFTWSNRGQRFIERCKTIFATSKLRGLNPFAQLQELL